MTKIIYIDESGISSQTGDSVYVSLYIEFNKQIDVSNEITKIEKQLKISYTHWNEMPWKLRLKFAEKIKDLDFEVKAMVYSKPLLPDRGLKISLFEFVKNSGVSYMFIDGKKNKKYEKELKSLLRDRGIKVYGLKIVDDKKESLIRLADFIAGSIRSYIDFSNKYSIFIFNLLKDKIEIDKAKMPD